ncbi:MAG: HAMP domain-containing sensor histidine kinase [Thermodesulfobacteriota bacterium]
MDRYQAIEERIRQTMAEQKDHQYTRLMDAAAKVFLALSLEYADLPDFLVLAVMIPKAILGWEASLYLDETGAGPVLAVTTQSDLADRLRAGEKITSPSVAVISRDNGEYHVPLVYPESAFGSNELNLPSIVGLLRVNPGPEMEEIDLNFLGRYAGVVALSIIQRLLARKNQQHINFIKNLVSDIGHNVIVPNIFFKAYLRRLAGKINRLRAVQEKLEELGRGDQEGPLAAVSELGAEMANANEGVQEEFDHIERHYLTTSLFLETLLRRSHFEQGQYVLQKRNCNFLRDIISPQVERFAHRLRERGIEIDLSAGGVPDQAIEAVADVGLISQVFTNLLSNAVKYTRPGPWWNGGRKFIAYGMEAVKDVFGPGADGVKINLFSTGPTLDQADVGRIFEEGYRGMNVEEERGTGHGLFFIKEVVELHGGCAGYEPTPAGNNFYFILPK